MPDNTNKILDAINATSGIISVGLPVAGIIIPIAVQVVKSIRATGKTETEEYSLVVQQNQGALDAIIAAGLADIDSINAELTRMGANPIAKPAA